MSDERADSMKNVIARAVLAGICIDYGVRSLSLDAMGKEHYQQMVEHAWMPAVITVPAAIFLLFCAAILLFYCYYQTSYLTRVMAQMVYRAAWLSNQDVPLLGRSKGDLTLQEKLMDAIQHWTTKSGKADAEWDAFYATLPKSRATAPGEFPKQVK